jgi:hypothetical protein
MWLNCLNFFAAENLELSGWESHNFPTGRHYNPGILSAKFIVDEPNKVVCGGVDRKVITQYT